MEKNRDPQIEFLEKLKERESSGRKGVVNKEGYMGFYQVGKDRLSDFKKESGFEFDKKEFLDDEGLQENTEKQGKRFKEGLLKLQQNCS